MDFSTKWSWIIPDDAPLGEYTAYERVYNHFPPRQMIEQIEETFEVVSLETGASKKPHDNLPEAEQLYVTNAGHVEKGIHHFKSQEELPPLGRVLGCARESIGILAWSAEDMATQHIDSIKRAINRNVEVTILVLDPDSDVASKGDIAISAVSLPSRIERSLEILCEERSKLHEKKNKFIIKTYQIDNNHSIILLDHHNDNAWIQVTSYVKGEDASSRPSKSSFKMENQGFYDEYFEEYKRILDEAKDHICE